MRRQALLRIALVFAILLALVLGALLALPFFIDVDNYRPQIAEKVSSAIGRKVEIQGKLSLSIFPRPHVVVRQVRVANIPGASAPYMAEIEELSASVELWPLLQKRIHTRVITLKGPKVTLEKLADGQNNWTFKLAGSETLSDKDKSSPVEFVLDELNVENGEFACLSPGDTYAAKRVGLTLTLVSLKGPYLLKGQLDTFGKTLVLDAELKRLSDPVSFGLNLDIEKNQLKVKGEWLQASSTFQGDVSFSGNPNVLKAFRTNLSIPSFLAHDLKFASRLKGNADSLELQNAMLELKGAKVLANADVNWRNDLKLKADVQNLPGRGHVNVSSQKRAGNYEGSLKLEYGNLLATLAWVGQNTKSMPEAFGKPLSASTQYSYGKKLSLQNLVLRLQQAELKGDVTWFEEKDVHHATANLKSPSLEALLAAFQTKLPSASLAGPFVFSGSIEAKGKRISIANLSTTFGSGLWLKGKVLADLTKTKPRVDATLVTSPLSVEMFTGPEMTKGAASDSAGPRWSKSPIDLNFLTKLDGNFDISTSKLTRKDMVMTNPRIVARLQNDTLSLAPLSGGVFGGAFNVNASASAAGALQVKASLNNAQIKALVPQDTKLKVVDGTLSFSTDLSSQGKSVHDIIGQLKGRVSLSSKNGTISGIDLDAVATRLANLNNVDSILALVRTALAKGKTKFSTYNGDILFNQGVGTIRNMTLVASKAKASATGNIDLPRYSLNVLATLEVTQPPNLPTFGVRLFGPIDNPLREYDTASLQRFLIQNVGKSVIQQVTKGQMPNVLDLFGGRKR